MTSDEIAYDIERAAKSPLLWNFDRIIGIPSYCPRCLLRGQSVRWTPQRHGDHGEFQKSHCDNCSYEVLDR